MITKTISLLILSILFYSCGGDTVGENPNPTTAALSYSIYEDGENKLKIIEDGVIKDIGINEMYLGIYSSFQYYSNDVLFIADHNRYLYYYDNGVMTQTALRDVSKEYYIEIGGVLFFSAREGQGKGSTYGLYKIEDGLIDKLVDIDEAINYKQLINGNIYFYNDGSIYLYDGAVANIADATTLGMINDSLFTRTNTGVKRVDVVDGTLSDTPITANNGNFLAKTTTHLYYSDSSEGLFKIDKDGNTAEVGNHSNVSKAIVINDKVYYQGRDLDGGDLDSRLYMESGLFAETGVAGQNMSLKFHFSQDGSDYLITSSTNDVKNIYKITGSTPSDKTLLYDSPIEVSSILNDYDGNLIFIVEGDSDVYKAYSFVNEQFVFKRDLYKSQDK